MWCAGLESAGSGMMQLPINPHIRVPSPPSHAFPCILLASAIMRTLNEIMPGNTCIWYSLEAWMGQYQSLLSAWFHTQREPLLRTLSWDILGCLFSVCSSIEQFSFAFGFLEICSHFSFMCESMVHFSLYLKSSNHGARGLG